MKTTVTKSDFVQAFYDMGRGGHFSEAGRECLYDYLTESEADIGQELELDVIAICCAFAEYANIEEFQGDFGDEYETIEDIERKTQIIVVDDEGFIIHQF